MGADKWEKFESDLGTGLEKVTTGFKQLFA